MFHNKKAGFTLVEVLVAVAILIMMIAASATTISLISQSRAKRTVTTVISKFELTRDYAKTHGGDAMLSLHKVEDGIEVMRTSVSVVDEVVMLEDKTLKVYYKLSNDSAEYELGVVDSPTVSDATLQMTFRQTTGAIIGPHKLDYIIFANNNKTYKLVIKQSTGMIYYDYEIDNDHLNQNNTSTTTVALPLFVYNGRNTDEVITIYLDKQINGSYATVQPDLNYDSRNIKIGGVYRARDPGTYTIVFSLKDPYSTCWEGTVGDVTDKTLTWKAQISG